MKISRNINSLGLGKVLSTSLTFSALRILFSLQLLMIMNKENSATATAQMNFRPVHLGDLDQNQKLQGQGGQDYNHHNIRNYNHDHKMSMSKPHPVGLPLPLALSNVNPSIRLSRPREFDYDMEIANDDDETQNQNQGGLMNVPVPAGIDPIIEAEEAEEALPVSKLTQRQIVELLLDKIKTKTQHNAHPAPRDLDLTETEREIKHMCAQHASITCGKDVLENVEGRGDTNEKCNMRKDFLDCVTDTREECNEMAKAAVYPPLPPKSQIAAIQKRVWRALWTSGGCILGN